MVYDLARQIVIGRGKIDDDAIARAGQAGYSSSEILEIVAVCTFAGLVGVVDNLAGRVKLDEFLTPAHGVDGRARRPTTQPQLAAESRIGEPLKGAALHESVTGPGTRALRGRFAQFEI